MGFWSDTANQFGQAKQTADAVYADNQRRRSGTGAFYDDLRPGVRNQFQAPGLDRGSYDKASGYADQAQGTFAGDADRFRRMAEGYGPHLGAQQARAGAAQAASAQQALANSARGGIYAQAAAAQGADRANMLGRGQAQQQANLANEQERVQGMGLFANAANVMRDADAARVAMEQQMANAAAVQRLGYQGIGDTADTNLVNMGFKTDAANQSNQNQFMDQYREIQNRLNQQNAQQYTGAWKQIGQDALIPMKAMAGFIGKGGGG